MMKYKKEYKTKVMGMRIHIQMQNVFTALLLLTLLGLPEVVKAIQSQTAQIQRVTLSELQQNFYKAELEMEISVMLQKVTLDEALGQIAKEAGLKLTYRGDILVEKNITLQREAMGVSEALEYVLDGTGLDYQVSSDGYLLISIKENASNEDLFQETVSGIVMDAQTGESLPGVNIVIEGTATGTATDENGYFELTVPSLDETLIISAVGYVTKTIELEGINLGDIHMEPDVLITDEIVVSGYQLQSEETVTGASVSVDLDELSDAQITDPLRALQGQAAGVFIQTSGDPRGGATVRIRGVSTLNNNDPLYVIDGVPTKSYSPRQINPNDIESIRILKDAAATSIYGSRASNGVILITTKKASQGLQINYNSSYTYSRYTTGLDMASTEEQGRILWLAAMNDGIPPPTAIYSYNYDANAGSDAEGYIERFGDAVLYNVSWPEEIAPGMPSSNTDWFDAISESGHLMEHQLSLASGGESSAIRTSLRYLTNDYIIRFQDYQRISARINSHMDFFDGALRVGENFNISNDIYDGYGGSVVGLAQIAMPILPVKTTDGGYAGPPGAGFDDRQNPVRLLDHNQWDRQQRLNIIGDIYTRLLLLDDKLSLSTRLGIDYGLHEFRDIELTYQTGFLSNDTNTLSRTKGSDNNWNFNTTAEYILDYNQHNASFLGGIEVFRNQYSVSSATRADFALETLEYMIEDAGTGPANVSGYNTGYSLLSFFGKFDYSFRDKYLASITVRRDGSSRFGSENRFGTFPAFSVGWRLNEEPFIYENLSFISRLRLRLSYGITGNQEIANDAAFTLYQAFYGDPSIAFNAHPQATAYDISGNDTGQLPSGFVRTQTGNPNLRWEQSSESNIGLDFGFFDNKLTGAFEYFIRNTNDILIQPSFIATVGEGGSTWINGASMQTKGFEVSLNYEDQIGQFAFAVRGNVGHYSDKITDLPDDVITSYPGNVEQNILGRSVNSMFGYVADGLFNSQQEVDDHAQQSGAAPGRIRYKDLNGDGVINSFDQKYIGVNAPDLEFGLNLSGFYKRFDLRVFFQGVWGRDVHNSHLVYSDFSSFWNGSNFGRRLLYEGWRPDRTNTSVPAATGVDDNDEGGGAGGGGRYSTYWVRDGSYLKIRQVTLGYTYSGLLGLNNVRFFVTGQNLLTLNRSEFIGPDPEDPSLGFPIPLQITGGLNITF